MKAYHTPVIERGILTSNYKREIRANAAATRSESLSKIKSVLMYEDHTESQAGTILKVALFFIGIVMITF